MCASTASASRAVASGRERLKLLTSKTENFIFNALMPAPVKSTHEQDLAFAQRVLAGDEHAAAELRRRYQGKIVGVLRARGASETEAEDLTADLWTDCFAARPNRQTLLTKFQGRCALESWLLTVATHRLVDLKRRQTFRVEIPVSTESNEDFFDQRPGPEPASAPSEKQLVHLLREATRQAFSKGDAESILMLKLVHLHQLTQREIARMWGWHESKVSRALEVTRENIARNILSEVKRIDPWLQLRWEDFVELCAGSTDMLFDARR